MTRKRLASAMAMAILAIAVAPFLASASPNGTFGGTSSGLALGLDVLALNPADPPGLTAGVSNTDAASTPLANARGAGTCEALRATQTLTDLPCTDSNEVTATVTTGESDPAKKCSTDGPASATPLAGALSIASACGDALAKFVGTDPTANALGEVGRIELSLNIAAISTQKDALIDTLGTLIPGSSVTETALLNALKGNAKVVAMPAGSTTSTVSSSGTTLKSRADASGGIIGILGVPTCTADTTGTTATCTANPDPITHGLIIITFSSAFAEASWDSSTPIAKAAAQPSVVTVKVRDISKPDQVAYFQEQTISPGSPAVPLDDLPLGFATTISIQGAQTQQSNADGKGSATATVDGVRIHALKGLGESPALAANGGLRLRVASANAAVLGQTFAAPPPLAATGRSSYVVLLALVAVLASVRLRRFATP